MGGGKPLQPFGDGVLLGRALDLARGYAEAVAVAVRDPAQVGDIDAPLIQDDPSIEGPLGGLAAALAHAGRNAAEGVLTLPCDAPTLPADLGQRLAAALEASPEAQAAVAASGGQLHPVCALWRVAAQDRLGAYLASGRRSLRGFAKACAATTVEWPAAPADPFANANTPEELEALRAAARNNA
jgi:molybdopterin-guanine dinucleotide biosynthesis protein A